LGEVNYLQTLIGDYHVDTEIEMNAAVDMINQAVGFLEAEKDYLGNTADTE
jgi:hypothetical protein